VAERVLAVGSGGREHAPPALALVRVIFCKDHHVGLVVVGPEVPLAAGIVDDLTAAGMSCFGPAAQSEASKSFSEAFVERHGIPTARYGSFADPQEARGYICASVRADCPAPVVKDRAFGAAGETVAVEEFLQGEEVSRPRFSEGSSVCPTPPAQDHKRPLDGDLGPNTGGMGPPSGAAAADRTVFQKMVNGINTLAGVPYAGLMLTKQGPKVLELNCRFGHPEGQVCFMSSRVQDEGLQVFHAGNAVKEGAAVSSGSWVPMATVGSRSGSGGSRVSGLRVLR
uniref:ATP-grasp domain-containing protein n=1 Tax=Mastacembelus armatus TaxID=205130 RepID=A0A3Q3N8J3_9TELE